VQTSPCSFAGAVSRSGMSTPFVWARRPRWPSGGSTEDQRREVASVAQTFFGVPFDSSQVIGETLERVTPERDKEDAVFHDELRKGLVFRYHAAGWLRELLQSSSLIRGSRPPSASRRRHDRKIGPSATSAPRGARAAQLKS